MKLSQLTIAQVKSAACPQCGAKAGQDCKYSYMGISRDGLHRQRRIIAKKMRESAPEWQNPRYPPDPEP